MQLHEIKEGIAQRRASILTGAVLLVLAAVLALLGILGMVADACAPVACGLVVAFVLNVFVHFFEDLAFRPFAKCRAKWWLKARYPLAVVLAYGLVLLLVVFVVGFIVPGIVESLTGLADTLQRTLPGTLASAMKWATEFAQRHDLDFLLDILRDIDRGTVLARVTQVTTDLLGAVVGAATHVASGMFTLVMGFFFSIYMLFGKARLVRGVKDSLKAFLPRAAAARLHRVGSLSYKVFYAFVRGQLTECVILGTLCYLGMRLLGLEYALLISSVVAITALIPILGAYIGAATGVIVLLLLHPIDALVFLIFLLILQQLEGNLIYPRVVGSSIGLPPVWTLFAVLFWGGVLGIPGIIVGTPATAVLYRLFRSAVRERLARPTAVPALSETDKDTPVE